MIRYITKTDRDEELIQKSSSQLKIINQQPDSYKGIVVPKPWGLEFLFYENEYVAAWFLSIDKGHSTSMHCHPNKRTVLIILSGIALGRTLSGSSIIREGEIAIYEPGVFHSTKAISKIEMAEIESPPIKTDLLRAEDNYGREKMGYEDKKTMKESSIYFSLNDCSQKQINNYLITKSNNIISGAINIVCEHNEIDPNTCVLETNNIQLEDSTILNFLFHQKEKSYEFRKYL